MSQSAENDVPIEGGVLRPLATTPVRELEVWRNAELRASLALGLEQSAAGETHDLGSFAQYVDSEEEEER